MSALSSIEWTDRTWNPVRGCSIVSPGCIHCYAMKFAHRFSGAGKAYEGLTKQTKAGPQWTGKIRLVEDALLEPLKWRKPQRIFVNSMSDLFHEGVPDEFIDRVFAVMALCDGTRSSGRHHTFQILTKRPERMRRYLSDADAPFRVNAQIVRIVMGGYTPIRNGCDWTPQPWPLPNVWLGVSCEDQQRADERIPLLLQTPAAVRFVSAEPLLGPIRFDSPLLEADSEGNIDWVIVGGESGPGARPCDVAWIRSIVDECAECSVPVFVKQLGSVPVMDGEQWAHLHPTPLLSARNSKHGIDGLVPLALGSSKGGDPSEWAAYLRVREFPSVEAPR